MRPRSILVLLGLLPALAQALSVTIFVVHQPLCAYANGELNATVYGGVQPYTYAWSGPNGFTSAVEDPTGLLPGTYSITVTDFQGTIATASTDLTVIMGYQITSSVIEPFCPAGVLAYGRFYSEQLWIQYGNIPYMSYTVDGNPAVNSGGDYTFQVSGQPGANYSYMIVDENGCSGTISGVANYEVEWPEVQLLSVETACSGANGGFTLGVGAEGHHQGVTRLLLDGSDAYVPANPEVISGGLGVSPCVLHYHGLAPGEYHFVLQVGYNSGSGPIQCSSPTVVVTVPDDPGCGTIMGHVFLDSNADCAVNGEHSVPAAVLQFDPGPFFATTDNGGDYSANLPLGSYTVTQTAGDLDQYCPPPPTMVLVDAAPLTQDFGDTAVVPMDVALAIASGAARPGFQLQYAIAMDALTIASSGAMQLVMHVDPALGYLGATPAPASVVGNTLTWNLSELSFFGHLNVVVIMQVPPDIALVGTVLNADASVTTANTDADLSNNSASTAVTVTASLDPNDKSVLTSSRYSGTQYFIGTDEWMDYTIRFQNTGTDTAFLVVVRDTLPPELDPATIRWGAASHACTHALSGAGLLTFTFANIHLPDSGANETKSHGFVSFRIRPRQPLMPGTAISNAADIYFDFNPPVHTNDAQVTTELSTGTTAVDAPTFFARVQGDQLAIFSSGPRLTVKVDFVTVEGKRIGAMSTRVIDAGGSLVPIGDLPPGYYNAWVQDERGGVVVVPFLR